MNTILIVEDSSSFAGLLKTRIQNALAVETILASSFAEVKALLQVNPQRFFFAILDLNLPDAPNGEIVELVLSYHIPGIVLTGLFKKESQDAFLKKGILDYFIKDNPGVVDSVIHAIDRVQKNKNIKILVVDDSRSARMVLSRFLERYGFMVLQAEEGETALQCIKENRIDLVITDYQMPGMDGMGLMKKVRAAYSRNVLAAIGLSSYGDAELATQFIKAGANDFLIKPYQPEELLCRVYQNLENIERYRDVVRLLDRHQSVLDHALDAIITIDAVGRVVEFNPAAEQMFGYAKGVVVGKNLAELIIPPQLRQAHQTGLLSFAKEKQSTRLQRRIDFPGVRSDGQLIDLQISLTSVMHHGVMHFTGFLQDVTAKKQLMKSLEETLTVAELANVAKSDFIANMSHEIRTPMNAILGFAELAMKAELTPRVRDYLGKINNASHSLMGIISDLLDFSKLEAGQMELDLVPFDLFFLLERLADLFSKQVADKKIELVFCMPNTFDDVLFGDVVRLEQVLINLIRNAVKFTAQGTITVEVLPEILAEKKVQLICSVQDTGIGVDPAILPNLFAPFVQADSSTTRKYGGTGLGLSICKRLVSLMGGRMWAESVPGEGSRFAFDVCVALHGENRRKKLMLPETMWGQRVLVVDDNPVARESLQNLLTDVLLKSVAVSSGQEAIDKILAANVSEDRFDFVLLDWLMPGMNGDVVAVEMRAVLEAAVPRPRMPKIFLLPPFGVEEAISKGEKADVDGFIDKPITRSRLIRGLSQAQDVSQTMQLDRRREKLLAQEEATGQRIGGARILLAQANEINQRIACELLERVGLVVQIAADSQETVDLAARFDFEAMLIDVHLPGGGAFVTMDALGNRGKPLGFPVIALLSHGDWSEKKRCLDAGMQDHLDLPLRAERLYGVLSKWVRLEGTKTDSAPFFMDDSFISRLAGLDVMAGLDRVAGNKNLYRSLLMRFCHTYSGVVEEVQNQVVEGQFEAACVRVYGIKNAARHLGAMVLSNAAGELQAALQGEDAIARQATLASFAYHMHPFLAGLGKGAVAVGRSQGEGGRIQSEMDLEKLSFLLAVLLDRLANFSIEVEPWLASLGELLQSTDSIYSFQELVRQIDAFHFFEAMELLQGFTNTFGCVITGESVLAAVGLVPKSGQKRVLIVDDQASNVNLLKAILEDYHRMVALNGQQALQAVQSREPPDLILLDIMMPQMNGYEVCRQLQSNPKSKEIPVIFVTARKQLADETEGFQLGAVDYITKPFQGEIVKRRVKTHLELKRHRDQLEQEVRLRTMELDAARQEAERAKEAAESGNRAKSTFLAHMSHEIRTPLNAILGVNELLGETEATVEQRNYLDMSRKASESLLALVNDVLDFSKIEAGQFDLEESCFDLHTLINGSVEILAIQAKDRGLQLMQQLDVKVPRYVEGDPNRLRQVLLNLLGNAIKFTIQGRVELQVALAQKGGVGFSIVDTGIGIPADKLETIFQPFRQADLSTTKQYGGTGLGLTICALLVEKMGGKIQVESIEGQGSRFYFTLPFSLAKEEEPVVSVVRQGVREPLVVMADFVPALRILLAEDSEDNQILINAFLKKTPHRLEIAENGQVAWEKFKIKHYDVVLMDLQMPILDGYAVTRKIRVWEQEKGLSRTPIIALTAHAMQEAFVDAMAAGCDYYLSKPIAKKRLLEVLQQFTNKTVTSEKVE